MSWLSSSSREIDFRRRVDANFGDFMIAPHAERAASKKNSLRDQNVKDVYLKTTIQSLDLVRWETAFQARCFHSSVMSDWSY